jgi:acyl carrier protein
MFLAHVPAMKVMCLLTEKEIVDVQNLVARETGMGRDQVIPEARLEADLQADSLTRVEIAMKIEEHFQVTVPDDAYERVSTFADLFELLEVSLGRKR